MSTPTTSANDNTSIHPTATATSSPNSSPQSSSLYLFTFLATLLLLLAVSCAIVIRSFILRRRFRRRLEEAIAAGVLLPESLYDPSRRRRDFGEKPKLWEVWVDDHEKMQDNAGEGGSTRNSLFKGEGKWDDILPVSATRLSSNAPKPIPLPGSGSAASLPDLESQVARHTLISRFLWQRPFSRPAAPPSPPVQSPPRPQNGSEQQLTTYPPSIIPKDREPEEEKLQVSVLISMPNPNYRRSYGSDVGGSMKGKERGSAEDVETEGDIPDVVFGVAEVRFRS